MGADRGGESVTAHCATSAAGCFGETRKVQTNQSRGSDHFSFTFPLPTRGTPDRHPDDVPGSRSTVSSTANDDMSDMAGTPEGSTARAARRGQHSGDGTARASALSHPVG
nr:hypothetical protein KPHV_02510 [Kitasatospora purpeofusca]